MVALAYDFTAGCEDTACGSEGVVLAVAEGVLAVMETGESLDIALVMRWMGSFTMRSPGCERRKSFGVVGSGGKGAGGGGGGEGRWW